MDIFDILTKNGYDISKLSEEELEELEDEFEDEKDKFLYDYIDEHQKIIAFEFAGRFDIKELKKRTD